MKKFLCFLLMLVMCVSFVACNDKKKGTSDNEKSSSEKADIANDADRITVEPKIEAYITALGLKSDGTVVELSGYKDELEWTSIIDIAVSNDGCIGLKNDGTVVFTDGFDDETKAEMEKWKDIVDITAFDVGGPLALKADGTIAVLPSTPNADDYRKWTDIVAIDGGSVHSLGLKKDGTCVAGKCGMFEVGQGNVGGWTDIKAVAAGTTHSVGLKKDGTVVATGENNNGECNVAEWNDIVDICASIGVTIGLKSDGTVVGCGDDTYGLSEISSWTDIEKIGIGFQVVIGMKNDGTIVVAGDGAEGMKEGLADLDLIP